MKGEILKLLKEADGYISGQELCERFGVSRTAVWKVMGQPVWQEKAERRMVLWQLRKYRMEEKAGEEGHGFHRPASVFG